MKDIHEVLRRKQAQYAQLGRQIEALQSAAEKLRMIAPLLAEEGDVNAEAILTELTEEAAAPSAPAPATRAAAAGAPAPAAAPQSQAAQPQAKPTRSAIPRWP
jgi:hypothetical protein